MSNGPTMSGTPREYNMLCAVTFAGLPDARFATQLACQPSASRAQNPDAFLKSSLFGPIGSSNVP